MLLYIVYTLFGFTLSYFSISLSNLFLTILSSYHLSLKYPLRILKEENKDTSQCLRPLLNHSRSYRNFDAYHQRPPTIPPYILTPHSQQLSTNSKSESESSEQTAGTNPKN